MDANGRWAASRQWRCPFFAPASDGDAPAITEDFIDAFDGDSDLIYDVGPQSENAANCAIGGQEGGLVVNVRVIAGDGREAPDSTVITVPTGMCANRYTGLLRYLQRGVCAPSETWLSLPDDGPLAVCVSGYTQLMRAVDGIHQCQPFESGRIIGNSTGSSPTSPGGRTR